MASGLVVRVVGGKGFVDVSRPIVVVYREGVVEVGLGVMRRRRRVGGSGSGVF